MSNTPPVVWLGNRKAVEVVTDPDGAHPDDTMRRAIPGKQCTRVQLAPGLTRVQAAHHITHLWPSHSDADTPAWVASTDPALASLLADEWGCELRDPELDDSREG